MTEWKLPYKYQHDLGCIRYGIAGSGPPVVLVHGTPWSSFNLRRLIDGLSSRYTLYYYDLLGYGQSEMSEGNVSLGVQNIILRDIIQDHWKLERPAIIGHDFGGATTLRGHLLNNLNFSRMVLIDPVAVAPWGSEFFRHVGIHEAAFAAVPDYIQEAIVRAYIGSAAYAPIPEPILAATANPWIQSPGKEAFYRQIAQAQQSYTDEVQERYGEISIPTLILWGTEDCWIPVERGRLLNKLIPGSMFHCIESAGHLVIEEKPDELLQHILPFLQSE